MSPISLSSNKSTQEVFAIVEEAASTVASGGKMNQLEKPSSPSVTRSVKSLIDKSGKKVTARKSLHQAQAARGNKKVERHREAGFQGCNIDFVRGAQENRRPQFGASLYSCQQDIWDHST
jgi:hypothetical protein